MKRLFVILIAFAALAQAASPKFGSREDYTGLYTEVTIITDVNNDGNPDLVAVLGGVVHILLGDGKGNFQPAPDQDLAATNSDQIIATDVNGDGNIDLILDSLNGRNGGFTVSLGHGDGTFDLGTFYTVETDGNGPGGIAVGDFNNDGKIDVVAAADNGVSFSAGNGDGTFQAPIIVAPLQVGSTGVAAADLNGDGNLDLIVDLGAAGLDGLGIGFRIYYGNGEGTFQAPISFSQPQRADRVAAGSLYAGGPPAIVMTASSSPYVWIFANDGKGNFSLPH